MPKGHPASQPKCSVEGCENTSLARGLCRKHYQRWAKYGDPLATRLDLDRSPEQRFWAFVDKTPTCWLWRGGAMADGYGHFWLNGRTVKAHRVAYEWLRGSIPTGLQLDHLCRTPACVNPSHLEIVTGRVNTLRGNTFPARNSIKTHCPQGHPYDAENTYLSPSGRRHCRECGRQRCRESYRRSR